MYVLCRAKSVHCLDSGPEQLTEGRLRFTVSLRILWENDVTDSL